MKNHQSELRAAEPNIGTYSITVSSITSIADFVVLS